ncbi:hypothetical protein [Sphingorhabdus sp.]|jgi:hypothetical protein|uniref:hypothetical protein n=1 Tax=Sphingorhabdus sp. TaxID=1902408 RepID=UPI003BB04E2F|nr:hypothetical protein [Sphingomonadales bacterium]MBL0023433.1 hypothetical protein [Sphingomonadales bacterium]
MRFRLFPLLLLTLVFSGPVVAAQEQITLSVAARNVGDSIARRVVDPDDKQADMLIAFIVKDGNLGVGAMSALEPNAEVTPTLEEGTVAVLRTRPAVRRPRSEPDAIDVALAKAVKLPVYIVSEWSRPPVIWEVSADGGTVNWRTIDESGLAGPWYEIVE